jgi:hypothetical protein
MDISQPEPNNGWTGVSYKRSRPAEEEYQRVIKHTKESNHWLNPTSSSSRYSALLDEENGLQQQQDGPENTPKPSPVYVSDVTTVSPLIQLLEQIAQQQYEFKALSNNQIKIQPKTSESYRSRTITQALTEKRTEFHTYRLKEERNYGVVIKNIHYSINPEEIKAEIKKLGHRVFEDMEYQTVRTKLPLSMFFVELKPAPNNEDIYKVEYLQQHKIKFEPPKHKRDVAQCAYCQRYGHTKNYCHLKPRCVQCAGNHLTIQCVQT